MFQKSDLKLWHFPVIPLKSCVFVSHLEGSELKQLIVVWQPFVINIASEDKKAACLGFSLSDLLMCVFVCVV